MRREPLALFVSASCTGAAASWPGRKLMDVRLDLPGQPLRRRLAVWEGPAGLADIVPVARRVCDENVRAAVRRAEDAGTPVPCRKGCSTCCRYLVPLSAPEALRAPADLASLPLPSRRRIERALNAAARRIIEAGPPPLPQRTCPRPRGQTVTPVGAAANWYARLHLACPMLKGHCCGFYPFRPIACREHLVTSSADCCLGFTPGRGKVLPVSPSVATALGELAAELEQREIEAVILPLAPAWYEANRHRADRTWPGPELVRRFAEILARRTAALTGAAPDKAPASAAA